MIKTDYRNRRIIILLFTLIIIRGLYRYKKKSIRIKEGRKEAAIRKGVWQGCNL